MLQPVERKSLSEAVFEQLAAGIVAGSWEPDSQLPSERELVRLLGVNRGAVREAVKRLVQARLVDVRHGGATRVLDYRQHGGLDLLERLLIGPDGRPDPDVARGVVEMRAALGPEAAAACARRAGGGAAPPLIGRLRERLSALVSTADLSERQTLALDYWDVVVEGSDNVAYRLAFNTLRRSYEQLLAPLRLALQDELMADDDYASLVSAIDDADASKASAVARSILMRGSNSIGALLRGLPSTPTRPRSSQ